MTPATTLTYDGVSQSIVDWALDYGITPSIIIGRLERGETIDRAITTPMKLGTGRQRLVLPELESFIANERVTWRKEHRKVRRRNAATELSHARELTSVPMKQSRALQTLTFDCMTMTVSEWAERTGISAATIRFRLRAGWPISKALGKDVRTSDVTRAELARESGIDPRTVDSRMRRGWSLDDALSMPPRARMGRFAHGRPGVVSDFSPFDGTGAGSTAQETPNITFSGIDA